MSIFQITNNAPAAKPQPKRILRGTDQQEAFWAELLDSDNHVLAEARAGCGKSTACREAMFRLLAHRPGLQIKYAVFNKANADEFQGDCPTDVQVGTMHKFGLQALSRSYRSQIEKNKSYLILDESREGRQLPRYMRKSTAMLVGHAKNQMLAPNQDDLADVLARLILQYDINVYGRGKVIAGWAADVLERSAEWVEVVDFDDMIWLPALHQLQFPACDLLFVDEVQDLNPAQHVLIDLLCSGRIVAVGDRFQAIYQFRGADLDSIPKLEGKLAATPLGIKRMPLTITFRCPKTHVHLAQSYVPDLQAHESNRDGEIDTAKLDKALGEVQPGDMVICPSNAPTIRAALQLIGQGRPAVVKGRAVGDQLLSVVRACGDCRTIADLAGQVEQWKNRELSRLSGIDGSEDLVESTQDRAAGVQAVLQFCGGPAEVEGAVNRLFSEDLKSNAVGFSTVHRAKGLEAERVYFINTPMRTPRRAWEERQQANLQYVALTRSKNRLTFVHA